MFIYINIHICKLVGPQVLATLDSVLPLAVNWHDNNGKSILFTTENYIQSNLSIAATKMEVNSRDFIQVAA